MNTPPTQAEIANDFGDEPWRALLAPLGGGVVLSNALLEAVRLVPSTPNARAFSVLDFLKFIWPHVDKSILSVTHTPASPEAEEMAKRLELPTTEVRGHGDHDIWLDTPASPLAKNAATLLRSQSAQIEALRADCARLETRMQELLALILDGDHSRGCQGREYACSCDYDDTLFNQATAARAALAARQGGGEA